MMGKSPLRPDGTATMEQQQQQQYNPMNLKIESILAAPPGTLNEEQVAFVLRTIERLCQPKTTDAKSAAAIGRAEILLQRLVRDAQIVTAKPWNLVISAYARLSHPPATSTMSSLLFPFQNAYSLLRQMLRLHQMHPHLHPPPTDFSYSSVMFACSKCAAVSEDAVVIAESLLKSLEQPNSVVTPTVDIYNNMILVHANRAPKFYGAATAAEDWLMHLSKQASAGITEQPDTKTFNLVLKAWSETPEESGAERALEILRLMLELADSLPNSRVEPDVISFGTVISAFSKRHQPEQCLQVLKEAIRYFSNLPGDNVVDLAQCWNATVYAFAKSNLPDALDRIEHLMIDASTLSSATKKVVVRPTTAMHAAYMEAVLNTNAPDRAEKAERQLRVMLEKYRQAPTERKGAAPTTREFDLVIHGWYRCREQYEGDGKNSAYYGGKNGNIRHPFGYCASHASDLLLLMIDQSENSNHPLKSIPRTGTWNMCIDSWCQTARAAVSATASCANEMTKSTPSLVVAVKNRQKLLMEQGLNAVRKAVDLLQKAEDRNSANEFSYLTVINALCKMDHPLCTLQAVKTLQKMEAAFDDETKDVIKWPADAVNLYVKVLAALARVRNIEAAEKALEVFRGIPSENDEHKRRRKRAIPPTRQSYGNVILAFSKVPGPRSAEVVFDLFQEMRTLDENKKKGQKQLLDTVIFEGVLWTLASSRDKKGADRACQVLACMLDLHSKGTSDVTPNASCFNAVLHSLCQIKQRDYLERAAVLLKMFVRKYDENALPELPSAESFQRIISLCRNYNDAVLKQHGNDIIAINQRLNVARAATA
jgi:hypothetical protein